jgi:hypothetical protein
MKTNSKMVLTQTGFSRLRACPKMFRIFNIEGYKPREESENLSFGTMWHEMKEMENTGHDVDEVCKYAYENARDDQSAAKLAGMHRSHVRRRDYGELAGTEIQFDHVLINPDTGRPAHKAIMAGKIDGLYIDPETGEQWIVEYKTASDLSGSYISRISLDLQVHIYKLAEEKSSNQSVVGVIYDAIKKPTIRLKKNETAVEYEDRVVEWYDTNEQDAFYCARVRLEDRDIERQAWMYYQEILWRLQHDYWPRNSGACLNHYGTRCPLFGYCDSGDQQHVLDMDFVKVKLNPELE